MTKRVSAPAGVVLVAIDISKHRLDRPGFGVRLNPDCQQDLEGKVVLVTGASSGIGAAVARAFGQRGSHVTGHGINP